MQRARRITMLIVIKLNLIILNTSKKQKQLAKDNSFTLPADTFLQAVLLSLICDISSIGNKDALSHAIAAKSICIAGGIFVVTFSYTQDYYNTFQLCPPP